MRYKGIAHEWLNRCRRTERLYQRHAMVQLLPLVFRPDGSPVQDSTPIIEELETDFPIPSLHPEEPATRFLSELLEEYGDEWCNKLMFHHRWGYPADQKHRSKSLARANLSGTPLRLFTPIVARLIVRRMIPRMAFAGANENNAPILIDSFHELVGLLETHLRDRPYLFGARPAMGDIGIWGQLWQAYDDPTCGAFIRERAPRLVEWIERMQEPKAEGAFEPLASLATTLRPLFEREVGARFLAWDAANARAFEAGAERTELTMDGRRYYQKTFKYPARTLGIIRDKYTAVADDADLASFLRETGCLPYLAAG